MKVLDTVRLLILDCLGLDSLGLDSLISDSLSSFQSLVLNVLYFDSLFDYVYLVKNSSMISSI